MLIYLTIFIIYLLAMLLIGYFYSRGIKNTEDYFLSGRRFGAFPIACTLAVSFIGGGMFMGITGLLVKYGIVVIPIILSMALSFVILGLVFGPRLRRLNLNTLPEFIAKRFDEKSRYLIAIVSLIMLLGGSAIQFKASGAILTTVFNVPYLWAILISAIIVTIYTTLGGFRSVVATDVVQTIIIFIGVAIALPFVIQAAGSPKEIIQNLAPLQDGQFFNFFSQGIIFVIGVFIIAIIYAIMSPENHQRLYASRDPKTAKRAGILAGIFYFIILSIVFMLGLVGLTFFPDLANPDNFMPLLATQILPTWLGAILLASVAAGIMSSADTNLVTASSIIITDFYEKYRKSPYGGSPVGRDKPKPKKLVNISRLTVIIISVVGIITALIFPTVADLLVFFTALMAAVASAPIIFGLFWKRATANAAFLSGLSGGLTFIAFYLMGTDPAKSALPSVLVSCIVLVAFSLKKTSPQTVSK